MSRHRYGNLGLTEKNCAFIRAVILDMHKDKTKADHYQEIFGSQANRKALISMASRLWASPSMQEYAEEVRAEMREKFMVTVESLTIELEEARQAALGAENPQCGAAVSATMGKAKLYGLDKQVVELTGKDGGPIKSESVLNVSGLSTEALAEIMSLKDAADAD